MIPALLTTDYVRRMRVAMEQELVKKMLKMSPLPADEPKARRWEWFEDTAADTSALSLDRWKIGQRSCRGKRETTPQTAPMETRRRQRVQTRLTPRMHRKWSLNHVAHSSKQTCLVKWILTQVRSRKETLRPIPLLDQAHLRKHLNAAEKTRYPWAHRMGQFRLQKCRAQKRCVTQPR